MGFLHYDAAKPKALTGAPSHAHSPLTGLGAGMFWGWTRGKTMRWITTIVVAIVLSSPARMQTRGGLDDLKAAGGGVGATPCSEFNQSREKPEIEAMFFSWTEGYLTGWNLGLPRQAKST